MGQGKDGPSAMMPSSSDWCMLMPLMSIPETLAVEKFDSTMSSEAKRLP
jgi:hypothetical protein